MLVILNVRYCQNYVRRKNDVNGKVVKCCQRDENIDQRRSSKYLHNRIQIDRP